MLANEANAPPTTNTTQNPQRAKMRSTAGPSTSSVNELKNTCAAPECRNVLDSSRHALSRGVWYVAFAPHASSASLSPNAW